MAVEGLFQTYDLFVVAPRSAFALELLALRFLSTVIQEDVRLFLECALRLNCQFGRHDAVCILRSLRLQKLSISASRLYSVRGCGRKLSEGGPKSVDVNGP